MTSGPAVQVSGLSGAIRVGYREAARLGTWTMRLAPALPRRYDVTAQVRSASDWWLAQRPLTLVLDVGDASWEWTDVEPVVSGGMVTVRAPGIPAIVRWARAREGG